MSSLKPIDVLAKTLIIAARNEYPYSNQKFDTLVKVVVNFRNFVVQNVQLAQRGFFALNLHFAYQTNTYYNY